MEEELEESSFDVRPPRPVFLRAALENIPSRFEKSVAVTKTIPKLRVFRTWKFALEEASFVGAPARCCRGWKLVMLPRMLLQQRSSGCNR